MQILVVGMHRSGTSTVTRLLNMLGAYFGSEGSMTAPNAENPKGFWERIDVRAVNDALLRGAGAEWDRVLDFDLARVPADVLQRERKAANKIILGLDQNRPWVMKEPRFCFTLPFWQEFVPAPILVQVVRDPVQVAISLRTRNGLPLRVGVALWEAYVIQQFRGSIGLRTIHVRHADVLADPSAAAARLLQELTGFGVRKLELPGRDEIEQFVDPRLFRSRPLPEESQGLLSKEQASLWALVASGDTEAIATRQLSADAQVALREHEPLARKLEQAASAKQAVTAQASRITELEARIEAGETRSREALTKVASGLGDLTKLAAELGESRARFQEQKERQFELAKSIDAGMDRLAARVAGDVKATIKQASEATDAKLAETRKFLHGPLIELERQIKRMDESLESGLSTRLASLEVALRTTATNQSVSLTQQLDALALRIETQLTSQSATYLEREAVQQREQALFNTVLEIRQAAALYGGSLSYRLGRLLSLPLRLFGKRSDAIDHILSVCATIPQSANYPGLWEKDSQSDRSNNIGTSLDASEHERLLGKLDEAAHAAEHYRSSLTYRVGVLATLPLRWIRPRKDALDHIRALATAERQRALSASSEATGSLPVQPRSRPVALASDGTFASHVGRIQANAESVQALAKLPDVATTHQASKDVPGAADLVSIVMPTYNRQGLILEAIASVREQTHANWELLICDDGSTDATESEVEALSDSRIRFLKLEHRGAAAARNSGLEAATGRYIAFLDTDNLWHPMFLQAMVAELRSSPGRLSAYSNYLDVECCDEGYRLRANRFREFSYDALAEQNYIDLNTFVHDTSLLAVVGGFTESLKRQQDWDYILKLAFLRDPIQVDLPLALYRRNKDWGQITIERRADTPVTRATVQANVEGYYKGALARREWARARPRITMLSWDVCRNHFSKAYNLAEAACGSFEPQLAGFHFFGNEVFEPYRGETETAPFRFDSLPGSNFPEFFDRMSQAWALIQGDVIYCVKPRLPSLGLALLANFHRGVPLILESNDSEAHVGSPQLRGEQQDGSTLQMRDCSVEDLLNPYSDTWSRVMDGYAREIPLTVTHNCNLDAHYGGKGYYIRNLKDEAHYDPDRHDRDAIRRELGFGPDDRVILFGGLLRKHKGIHELVELVRSLKDSRYKLLFVGSRVSPDQEQFAKEHAGEITLLPPQGRNRMAQINLAADLVVLWLDPNIPASHYQMPYKFTDAIAMQVPVIANPISDLAPLAAQGYLRLVEFGDFEALRTAVGAVFDQAESTAAMVAAARNLYLRQFSYAAANTMLKLLYEHADAQRGVLPVAERFAQDFAEFRARIVDAAVLSSHAAEESGR